MSDRSTGEAGAGGGGDGGSASRRDDVDSPENVATDTPEVVTVGAATVDRTYALTNLPEPDGGAYARDVVERPGGVGANVAVGCARLGRDAGLVARLGDDDLAERVESDLAESPVDTVRVRSRPGTSTHCLILRDGSGERMIVTAGDSTRLLRLDDADRAYLRGADAVFVTAYVPDAVTAELADLAREPGFPPLAFDLAGPLAELADRGTEPETVDRMAAVADLFVVGEVAAESHLEVGVGEAPAALRERGVDRGAVTRGDAGATLFDGDDEVHVPAFDVDVVDATGAGDAFVAGLLDAWVLGDADLVRAGRWAAAIAGLNCGADGARGGMPDRDAVLEFLDDR